MKRFCLAVCLVAAVFVVNLPAQILETRANIPFDFWLHHQLMPAGEYLVQGMGAGVLTIRGQDGQRSAGVFIGQTVFRPEARRESTLEFTKYGNTYFLSKIWNAAEARGYAVPKSPREKELARHSVTSGTTSIALIHR